MLGKRNHCRIVGVRKQGNGKGERGEKSEGESKRGKGKKGLQGSHVRRYFTISNFARALGSSRSTHSHSSIIPKLCIAHPQVHLIHHPVMDGMNHPNWMWVIPCQVNTKTS